MTASRRSHAASGTPATTSSGATATPTTGAYAPTSTGQTSGHNRFLEPLSSQLACAIATFSLECTSTVPQEFRREARPVRADLVVTTVDGQVHTQAVTLNDKPGPQTVQTGISDVATVRIILRAAAGLAPGRHIALGEVEFFKRS